MKVALVVCPNPVLNVPTAHFPPGILYVGRSLRLAGHDVQIVDLRAKTNISDSDIPVVDCVAVTATSGEINYANQIKDIAIKNGALTMIGGPHATFMTKECKKDGWDFVIVGDGEESAKKALKTLTKGIYEVPIPSISGYYPEWSLVGKNGFSRELFTGSGYGLGPYAAGILTSRGCPFKCAYCRDKRDMVRFRPINEVYVELATLSLSYGIHYFRFYDECMTINKDRTKELFKMFKRFDMEWRAHTRANIFDAEMAIIAKDAGCQEMGFGFESADKSVLKKIHKQENVDHYREAIRLCHRYGIKSKAFWMTSLPGETWESIDAIKQFMTEEKPDKWIVSQLCPYPGSDIWARPDQYDVKWMEKDFGKFWNFSDEPLIEYKDMDKAELKSHYTELKSWLESKFNRNKGVSKFGHKRGQSKTSA